jgi:hypothetical protein
MRPRFVTVVLLLASGLLGIAVLFSKIVSSPHPVPVETGDSVAMLPPESSTIAPEHEASTLSGITNDIEFGNIELGTATPDLSGHSNRFVTIVSDAEQARFVGRRANELYSLAMNDDTASRDTILSELQNPDKRIREAALEAAIQFNDRSVVPYLKDIANQTEDPREKVAILDAIDYINLPSLTELIAKRKALGLPDAPPPTNRPARHRPSQQKKSPAGNP